MSGMKLRDIHIGRLIRQRLDETGMSYSEFATSLCCQRHSLYYMFEQKSIDVEKLARISRILDYDFLRLYSSGPEETETTTCGDKSRLALIKLPAGSVDSFMKDYPQAILIDLPVTT